MNNNISTISLHTSDKFAPIHGIMKADTATFVKKVSQMDDDTFSEFVDYCEKTALWYHHNGYSVRPTFCEIRSGKKNRQFTEWKCQYIPLPYSRGENYFRNLGTDIKEAYAKVRASAGVHMEVIIHAECLDEYAKKGVIDFGKYKGTHIDDLPESYIVWLAGKARDFNKYSSFFQLVAEKVKGIMALRPGFREEAIGEKVTATITITGTFDDTRGFYGLDNEGRKIFYKGMIPLRLEKQQSVTASFIIKSKEQGYNGDKITKVKKFVVQ